MHHRSRPFAAAHLRLLLAVGLVVALAGPARAEATRRLADIGPLFGAGFEPESVEAPAEQPFEEDGPLVPETYWSRSSVRPSPSSGVPWSWQWMAPGLVWRSYLAGVKEPRFALAASQSSAFDYIWDATLGGRVSLWRYGTPTAYRPEGWELQLEGAALPRIWPGKFSAPLISCDYRVGLPLVYARGKWQFKTGYYHISAHLGDEYMILNPSVTRINYMRDAWMLGVGYYWTENLRLFAETDWAFGADGGAKPWEFQFGADFSPAVRGGAPFFAVYGNLRQELNYGGFFVVQTGWQWRGGPAMTTFRIGVQYVNGASTQYEFYNKFEQMVGCGIWYDY